jgi:predicted DCC family thiol-disulfide oxidoreductase YuxK
MKQPFNIPTKPIILFDGYCNFCTWFVDMILRKDKKDVFLFAPIQSKEARLLLKKTNENFVNLNTIYLVSNNKNFKRSTAIFKILEWLPYPWKLISIFRIFPVALTDFCYKLISKYRYKIFGKSEELYSPKEQLRQRFL